MKKKLKEVIDVAAKIQNYIMEIAKTSSSLTEEQKNEICKMVNSCTDIGDPFDSDEERTEYYKKEVLNNPNLNRGSNCLIEFFDPYAYLDQMFETNQITEKDYESASKYWGSIRTIYWKKL